MEWLERWSQKHAVEEGTPLVQLSDDAKVELVLGADTELAEAGDVQPLLDTADHHANNGDLAKAAIWWERAAQFGHAGAMVHLGAFELGRGKIYESMSWYRRGARAGDEGGRLGLELISNAAGGDAGAMLGLAGLFIQKENWEQAIHWCSLARDAGHPEAAHDLGVIYQQSGDTELAAKWYIVSADSGYEASLTGLMQTLDRPAFLEWLMAAHEARNPIARKFVRSLQEE